MNLAPTSCGADLRRLLSQSLKSRSSFLPADQVPYAIARERSRSEREGTSFSVLLVTVQLPDAVAESDTANGRPDSVRVLQAFEAYLKRRIRLTDDVFKLRENTFGLILSATNAEGAECVAADLRSNCDAELSITIMTYPTDWYDQNDGSDVDQGDLQLVPFEAVAVRPYSLSQRARDIVLSGLGLVLLSPVMAATALLIKLTSPGTAIFAQTRVGLGGKRFTMFKFRSMVVGAEGLKSDLERNNEQDGPAFKMTNDPRVTWVGRWIRKLSIDELPQLWNVLRGDMTLVGPRPLLVDEIRESSTWQKQRLSVLPGITCIWQVKARNQVSFDEWMRMDLRYIREESPLRDFLLMMETVHSMFVRPSGK